MHMTVKTLAALLLSVAVWVLPYTSNAGEKITKPWVTGYLPAYEQSSDGSIAFMDEDDWKMVTHIVHFAAHLNSNGSLKFEGSGSEDINPTKRAAAITAAHSHSVPILFSVVEPQEIYRDVLANTGYRQTLINSLVAILDEGYDGLDIDLEPITPWGSAVNSNYELFITELHAKMKQEYIDKGKKTPLLERPLLTIAGGSDGREATLLARHQDMIDQINIMFYNMVDTNLTQTWHDSALYASSSSYPSIDASINTYLEAGIPASKLGLGVSLEMRLWKGGVVTGSSDGVTQPKQSWTTQPQDWITGAPLDSVAQLMQNYYQPAYYHWDKDARAAYLSINNTGSANDMFISYNDPRSVTEKINYIKQNGLGGLMLWHLRLDYQPEKPVGQRRPIMKAVRKALHTGAGK